MTDGYESWWDVGIATTSSKESVRKACVGVLEGRRSKRLLKFGIDLGGERK